MASPYEVLGVDPDADRETIERRYRELVKDVHPDAGGSAEEFKRVKKAYLAVVDDDSGEAASERERSANTSSNANRRQENRRSDSDRRRSSEPSDDRNQESRRRTSYVGGGRRTTESERSRQRASTDPDPSGRGASTDSSGSDRSRRWVLFGISTLVGAGVLAHHDGVLTEALAQLSGGESTRADTVSREVAPDELFDVEFTASAGSEIHFTVDGADSSDWVNVYTEAEYERVTEDWDESEAFDPGDPLETVLTEEGYVCELPEEGTYVVLVKLWSGPPDDPRDPREVEVSYEIRS